MNRPVTAALLSGLVFPGIGHFYLKRYVRGALLAFGAALAIYYIGSTVLHIALDIVEKSAESGVLLDMATISGLVSQVSEATRHSTNIATTVFLVFWVVGIVDSYRVGHTSEQKELRDEKNA